MEEDTISKKSEREYRVERLTRRRMLAEACGRVTTAAGKVESSVKRDILLYLGIVVKDKREK